MASEEEHKKDQLVERCQDVIRYSEKVLADPSRHGDFADYWAEVEADRRRATFVVVDGDAKEPDLQSS
jgi:hypothetical protein